MISASSSCFPHNPNGFQMYGVMEEMLSLSPPTTAVDAHAHSNSLLYNLSILRDKVEQLESIVSMVVSTDPIQRHSAAMAATGAGGLVQEIIVAASSMMFAFQQLATSTSMASSTGVHVKVIDEGPHPTRASNEVMGQGDVLLHGPDGGSGCTRGSGRGFSGGDGVYDGYNTNYNNSSSNKNSRFFDNSVKVDEKVELPSEEFHDISPVAAGAAFDVIELDAADLLAKYTHYCQVCGKGFKRDANLRMHMRAHGDEYKTNAALSNPMKKNNNNNGGGGAMGFNDYNTTTETTPSRKYSCPQEGCRWNRKHAKFQPLKSMVCVKNHYRRSHCPKMYVCNRCNRKQFSVLSDLRTHEKHCGDLKWRCSCGTTFSRKDKLMGHVALFVGHAPAIVT